MTIEINERINVKIKLPTNIEIKINETMDIGKRILSLFEITSLCAIRFILCNLIYKIIESHRESLPLKN